MDHQEYSKNRNSSYQHQRSIPQAAPLPENYVDEAERVMHELSRVYTGKAKLSTSKIRNLFSLIS